MKSDDPINLDQQILMPACGGIVILLIILIMNKDYPFVGHDYRYFIPRLIDTDLHISLNGWSIQWYTPSFGGGLPAFPNPQHIEYSIVQLLSLWVNPWLAVLISTAGISLVGYYFFYKFLSEKLELNWMASILGAMFFIGNGFYIEHLIVGHLGYQLFPLSAIILYTLTDTRNGFLYNSSVIAVVIALIVHQAGFYLLIILVLSIGITLPIILLYKPMVFNLKNMIPTATTIIILSIAMTASKVSAVYAFMNQFPRQIFDSYNVGLLQALVGMVAQLFGVMALEPILILTRQNPEFLAGALSNVTGANYGIWELDAGLSPILIVSLCAGLAQAIRSIRKNAGLDLTRSRILSFIVLIFAIWITAQITLARGTFFPLMKQLPILRSLHVNVRFASAFILPLVILGTFQFHNYFCRNPKLLYFYTSTFLTSVSLLSFFSLSGEVHSRNFNVSASNVFIKEIQSGEIFPVTDITGTATASWQGFTEHSSLYKPYEPIFGYNLEMFTPEIHPGEILEIDGGYFNMTNPASLVYPEINNLHPFERIKASEREKLDIFLERRQPEWNIPLAQRILNIVSLVALILDGGILLMTSISRIVRAARDRNSNH